MDHQAQPPPLAQPRVSHAARRVQVQSAVGRAVSAFVALLIALDATADSDADAAAAPVEVSVPSLEQQGGQALTLNGYWYAATQAGRRPTVLLLHGCGGPHDGHGQPSARMREYSALLNAQGWHALVLDSFTPRGEKELCTQRIGTRAITMSQRRLDALGALAWLARRSDVDAGRLALLGWSNGGSSVLAASNLAYRDVALAQPKPRALAAFYPGCEAELKRGYTPSAPLQLFVGAQDDWTPAQACEALAARAPAGMPIAIERYAGAYHGFDSDKPLRLRKDVPNGVHPGQGVHVGGNAAALEASRARLLAFLREQLQ